MIYIRPKIDSGGDLGNRGKFRDLAASSHDHHEITICDNCWMLVVDTALKARRPSVDKFEGSAGLGDGDTGVDIVWDNITTEYVAASHVISECWVALGHHGSKNHQLS